MFVTSSDRELASYGKSSEFAVVAAISIQRAFK